MKSILSSALSSESAETMSVRPSLQHKALVCHVSATHTAGVCRESMVRSAVHRLCTRRPGKDPSICVTWRSRQALCTRAVVQMIRALILQLSLEYYCSIYVQVSQMVSSLIYPGRAICPAHFHTSSFEHHISSVKLLNVRSVGPVSDHPCRRRGEPAHRSLARSLARYYGRQILSCPVLTDGR